MLVNKDLTLALKFESVRRKLDLRYTEDRSAFCSPVGILFDFKIVLCDIPDFHLYLGTSQNLDSWTSGIISSFLLVKIFPVKWPMYGCRIVASASECLTRSWIQNIFPKAVKRPLSLGNMKRKAAASRKTKKEITTLLPKPIVLETREREPPGTRLPSEFYDQECGELAKALLGQVLVRKLPDGQVLRGTIVETEAYPGGEDKASQSFGGRRTERNEPMYMTPGTTYVYFTYGMYHCFNISSRGDGSAVLLRGMEPKEEYEVMHNLRKGKAKATKTQNGTNGEPPKKKLKLYELGNGPSKLCMALDITRHNCNKLDLALSDELWVETNYEEKYYNGDFVIDVGKRIGIDSTPPEARNKLWRYYIRDNFSVSKVSVSEIKKRLAKAVEAENGKDAVEDQKNG